MATVVGIISSSGLRTEVSCRNQPKTALHKLLYFHFKSCLKQLYISNETELFNYKGGYGIDIHVSRHLRKGYVA